MTLTLVAPTLTALPYAPGATVKVLYQSSRGTDLARTIVTDCWPSDRHGAFVTVQAPPDAVAAFEGHLTMPAHHDFLWSYDPDEEREHEADAFARELAAAVRRRAGRRATLFAREYALMIAAAPADQHEHLADLFIAAHDRETGSRD